MRAASSPGLGIASLIARTSLLTAAARGSLRCSPSARSAMAASISPSTPGASRRRAREAADLASLRAWACCSAGVVAGALGWYFDSAQLHVVIAKFWAYADVDYRLDGRALGDFTTYPIFNKYGMINLGEVAGGVRLF